MFDQFKDLIEKKVAADSKAWELQKAFVEGYAARQSAFVNELLETYVAAARSFTGVKSIGEAFEKQAALGESVKGKLVALTETNGEEVKKLQSALADVYAIGLPVVAAKKKAA